ncbi:tyrosine-type recombinase/integrase [Thermus altitudinis]|uniref:tyrosine-type recombinase/integrase n=1 Tax=Thermus altitudinis TaxID=2908145 RepID=UPI00311AAAFC
MISFSRASWVWSRLGLRMMFTSYLRIHTSFPGPAGRTRDDYTLSYSPKKDPGGPKAPTWLRGHDLRHTHATLLLRKGVPVEVVSEKLGHATPAFTLTQYRHILPEERREYALSLADLTGTNRAKA